MNLMFQLLDLRRVLADGRIDEEAMLGLASDAAEQGVLRNIPVSRTDDRRIQLHHVTLVHLSGASGQRERYEKNLSLAIYLEKAA